MSDLPPGVYRNDDPPVRSSSDDKPPMKPDWKDFVALTAAAYSIVFPYLFIIMGGVVVVFLLLSLLFKH